MDAGGNDNPSQIVMRGIRVAGLSVLLAIVVGSAAIGGSYGVWRWQWKRPIALMAPKVFEIERGMGVRQTLEQLQQQGIIDASWPYRATAWLSPDRFRHLKAGEFALTPGMTPDQLIDKLSSDEVVTYSVTIPEGRTFAQMRGVMDGLPKLDHRTGTLSDAELMRLIGHDGVLPEGRFLPTTYRYHKGMSDVTLYRQAFDLMNAKLDEAWRQRDAGLPYRTIDEALVMASLIEMETGIAEERKTIAGVFVRRLYKGMRLQTDPAVAYGLKKNARTLTRADLTTPTPYNTYMNEGLPPTPIALPGQAALEAALHPAPGSALYFVATGNGGHRFSDSLEQHQQAVRDYLRVLRAGNVSSGH